MKSLEELAAPARAANAADFVTIARLLAASRGRLVDAMARAEAERAPERVRRLIKASAEAGGMESLGGLTDLHVVSNGFVDSLRNIGVFDRMMPAMRRVPLANPDIRVIGMTATGYFVGETQPKPVSELDLTDAALDRRKADAIIVVSDAIAKLGGAAGNALLSRELRAAAAAAVDADFLAELAQDATATASAGGTAAQIRTDIEGAVDRLEPGSASMLFLVVPAPVFYRLGLKADTTGGAAFPNHDLGGIIAVASDQVPPGVGSPAPRNAMLIDAASVAADAEPITLDIARHATLQMSSSPDGGSDGLTSLWQRGLVALRASRFFGFRKLRPSTVQVITSIDW